jgi:hypothetical protein
MRECEFHVGISLFVGESASAYALLQPGCANRALSLNGCDGRKRAQYDR